MKNVNAAETFCGKCRKLSFIIEDITVKNVSTSVSKSELKYTNNSIDKIQNVEFVISPCFVFIIVMVSKRTNLNNK